VDWRRQNSVFTDIAATRGWLYNITGDGPPEQLLARRVTGSFWSVLGARPFLGRVFTEQEDQQRAPVAVLSYGLWQRRFGGDAGVLGRTILLSDQPHVIVGVIPREFYFLPWRLMDLWTPAGLRPEDLANRRSHYLNCVARLKPGVTLEQAQAERQAISRRLAEQHTAAKDLGAVVVPVREQLAGNTRLARGAARERELVVRAALLFGAAPALSAARVSIHDALKTGGRGSIVAGRQWFRDSLVVVQSALALVLQRLPLARSE